MGIDYTKRPGQGQPAATPPPATTAPAAGPVSLTKGSPTVSLSKSTGASGMMRVNLNWDARPPGQLSGGFFRGVPPAIDLDLGCLYELTDGTKGCVQALGNSFRDKAPGNPIIRLDGDDRSGTNTAGENLFIDLNRLAEIKRVAVFALIYEGVPNWAAANGVVTLFPVGAPTITVRLDEPGSTRMCAIAMLENHGGQLVIHRMVHHFAGHKPMDEHYGWGMQWQAGRK